MIIYCSGPIKGDTSYQDSYKEIIKLVDSLGHSALSELNTAFKSSLLLSESQIFTRDIKWMEKSDLMIAEVSGPSLGVGFEIAYALYNLKIPALALASENAEKVSAMISGCNSGLLTFSRYTNTDDIRKIVLKFIDKNSKK